MFWGDTKLVFWESIGRSDCTSFSRIGLKISQMANLFVFIFLQKRVSEVLTSLFVLFFERLISQTKNFYEICSKFLEFQKLTGILEQICHFWRIGEWFVKESVGKLICWVKVTFFLRILSSQTQNQKFTPKNGFIFWNSRNFEQIL